MGMFLDATQNTASSDTDRGPVQVQVQVNENDAPVSTTFTATLSARCSVQLAWNHGGKVIGIHCFESSPGARPSTIPEPVARLIRAFHSYFENGLPLGRVFWDELETSSLTEFQLQVYEAITRIPHGETRTYGWVAERLNKSSASRAVGQALKKNPFPILVPCHRVVASGSLGGFMGRLGPNDRELELKRHLLRIEEEYLNPVFPFLLGTGS